MYFCFCFKQKTAYEMRISDWSSDVCSSDLLRVRRDVRSGTEAELVVENIDIGAVGRPDDILGELVGRRPEIIEARHRAQRRRVFGRRELQFLAELPVAIELLLAGERHGRAVNGVERGIFRSAIQIGRALGRAREWRSR